jgi:hypothetical protein
LSGSSTALFGYGTLNPLIKYLSFLSSWVLLAFILLSCSALQNDIPQSKDICACVPVEPDVADFRHTAKHVPLPDGTPQEISVDTILGWPQDAFVAPDAPRTGRELQLFHVAHAFLQNASINNADCDIHLEISQTADKNAPRVVVETPVDSEYCTARRNIQSQLAQQGFTLDSQHGGELPAPLPVEITGLAFEDFEHNRGSAQVATLWELHPAIVNLLAA